MRFAWFFVVTIVGVLAGHVVAWGTKIGPLGAILILAMLFRTYRALSRRFHKSPPTSSRSSVVQPEIVWSAFAASCLLGGGIGGMMAYNPDGYMQPRPSSPPWELIGLGTVAGALLGLVVVALISLANRWRRAAYP